MAALVSDIVLTNLDQHEVLRYLGYRDQTMDDELLKRMYAAIQHCLTLARPRMAVRTFAVAGKTIGADGLPELHLSGAALILTGNDIVHHLAQAQHVGVFAVTLGMGVERELQRLSLAGDTLDQLMLDAAATAAVECAADVAEATLVAEAAEQGMGVTSRFSPGYGDLPLCCQASLLASIDATRRLGLTLTDSDLLVPTKSVTALVGIGEKVECQQRSSCALCTLREQCSLRKRAMSCRG